MNNIELKEKIEGILAIKDFFEREVEISKFEKEYKGTDFFKITKKPLGMLVKEYRIFNLIDPMNLKDNIQKILNNLNFDNVKSIIDELGDVFGQENEELLASLEEIKNLAQ